MRAPALYVVGFAPGRVEAETAFRLPCPPRGDDRPLGAAAAELRMRKAYFATLEALRTGQIATDRVAKLRRLIAEVRSETARAGLQHLRRVLRFVRWTAGGWPVIPAPMVPLDRIVVTAPVLPGDDPSDEELAARYAWALDWLRMHRWVVGRGLRLEWRLYEPPRADAPVAAMAVAVEPEVRAVPVPLADPWPGAHA